MTRRLLLAALLGLSPSVALAQTFKPQTPAGLAVSFSTERTGGTRTIIFGDIRNSTNASARHVVLMAEGLDESGRVVSRARGYVAGSIPSRGNSTFEIRLNSSGSEKRYRVQIESYEFVVESGN